jgi:hypothetical protein
MQPSQWSAGLPGGAPLIAREERGDLEQIVLNRRGYQRPAIPTQRAGRHVVPPERFIDLPPFDASLRLA